MDPIASNISSRQSSLILFFIFTFFQCLTAYNCFFQQERQRLLESLPPRDDVKSKKAHGKIGFSELGKTISRNWKKITAEEKAYYYELAAKDKKRYLREMTEWKALLAERDDGNEVVQGPSRQAIETRQVIKGSVAMDQAPSILVDESLNLPPIQQSTLTLVGEHDAMLGMATEDLMDLAVKGSMVFSFDDTPETSATATCGAQTTLLEGDGISEMTVVTDDSVPYLDKGCQDLLAAALF